MLPLQALFQSSDPERQGVRLRVTAAARAAAAAGGGSEGDPAQQVQALHEEVLDRTAFQERASLMAANKGGSSGSGEGGAAAPAAPGRSSRLRQHYGALKPFVIISLSYLLFTTTDGAGKWLQEGLPAGARRPAASRPWLAQAASAVALLPA